MVSSQIVLDCIYIYLLCKLCKRKTKKIGRKVKREKENPDSVTESGLSWDLRDLNPEPAGYESAALTNASIYKGFCGQW